MSMRCRCDAPAAARSIRIRASGARLGDDIKKLIETAPQRIARHLISHLAQVVDRQDYQSHAMQAEPEAPRRDPRTDRRRHYRERTTGASVHEQCVRDRALTCPQIRPCLRLPARARAKSSTRHPSPHKSSGRKSNRRGVRTRRRCGSRRCRPKSRRRGPPAGI